MTIKQRLILGFGLLSFVVIGLFPPWVESVDIPYRLHMEKPAGFGFITSPPPSTLGNANLSKSASMSIDVVRLCVEWAITAIATAVLFLILRSKGIRGEERVISDQESVSGSRDVELAGAAVGSPADADKPVAEILFTFQCGGIEKHRLTHKSKINPATCSRCGKPFRLVATTERRPDESERFHMYRALTAKAEVEQSQEEDSAQSFNDEYKSAFAKAISELLAMQMVVVPKNSIEDAKGQINRKAIGYIYGFIDCALQSIGQDMGDVSIGVPITFQVLRHLFPGREQTYARFLTDHLKDEAVALGMMAGGQQFADFIIKPGAKGAPMGLGRFVLEGQEGQPEEGKSADARRQSISSELWLISKMVAVAIIGLSIVILYLYIRHSGLFD